MNPFLIRLLQRAQKENSGSQSASPEIPRSWWILIGSILAVLIAVITLAAIKQHAEIP